MRSDLFYHTQCISIKSFRNSWNLLCQKIINLWFQCTIAGPSEPGAERAIAPFPQILAEIEVKPVQSLQFNGLLLTTACPPLFRHPSYGPAVPPAHYSQPHTDNQLLALFRDVLYWNLFFNWSHPLIQLGLEFHNFYCTSRLNYFYSIEFRMLLILFLVKSNPLVR